MPPSDAVRTNQVDLHRFVFEAAPVALWVEDFRGVADRLTELRAAAGVTDIRSHLRSNPAMLEALIGTIVALDVNPAGVRLVGAENKDALLGPIPAEIIGEDTAQSFVDQIEAVWSGKEHVTVELEGTTYGGNVIDCMLQWSAPRTDDELDLSRVVVAISDITSHMEEERRVRAVYGELEASHRALAAAHDELGRTQAQLLQSQRLESIGELAAGIAHEINTPIQYVGDNVLFVRDAFNDVERFATAARRLRLVAEEAGLSEAITDFERSTDGIDLDYLSTEVPQASQEALDGVTRVAEIVRALKDFAHPGSEEPMPTDLVASIQSSIAVARHEWKHVADIITNYDPHLGPVPALAGPLNQAFLNIIVNAAHAIAEQVGEFPAEDDKGTISIITRLRDHDAEIRIADTGGGIPSEIRDRVFDPFFTTKDIGKGSGQGLAIAHNVIAERHGGSILIETGPSGGTTFVVRLPLEHVQQEAA